MNRAAWFHNVGFTQCAEQGCHSEPAASRTAGVSFRVGGQQDACEESRSESTRRPRGDKISRLASRNGMSRLRRFSEWAWGKDLLERAVSDREVLALRREIRGIVFIDIRGFTAWSDRQDPETVVDMLNRYYAALGEVLRDRTAVKTKYSADEAMVVFAEARDAIAAARAMRGAAQTLLAEYGLSAGVGVHCGATVEGLLGSMEVKLYDVIGDTVNVAKRLCDQAAGGEILASGECMRAAGIEPGPMERRALSVKGKPEPIEAFLL